MTSPDPHRGQPILAAGTPPDQARAAVVCLHGRGAGAEDILGLAEMLALPDLAYLAPEAAGSIWYPEHFRVPTARNQPWLDSALGVVGVLLEYLARGGIPAERVALLGFSQGACLALEYAARNPRRYLAVFGLSGGLIGADDELDGHAGDLAGTPVFLGCSDVDYYIPKERVERTAEVLRGLGADVTTRLYGGMGHTVNEDELDFARGLLSANRP
ncbi:MAG TPA: dienelactone hydrolase family protein [Solirubrobacterales bacterium]